MYVEHIERARQTLNNRGLNTEFRFLNILHLAIPLTVQIFEEIRSIFSGWCSLQFRRGICDRKPTNTEDKQLDLLLNTCNKYLHTRGIRLYHCVPG
jgi:hypothetical protein